MTSLMMQSILEQPEALGRVLSEGVKADKLAVDFEQRGIRKIWIVGSGTSYFAAMIAAEAWEKELGIDCEATSSLEFLDRTAGGDLDAATMVVAVSQSGASLILLEGIRRANSAGSLTVVITAEPAAPIPSEAGYHILTHTGPETNLGKCKGFTTTAFAAVLLGRRLLMNGANADAELQARYANLPGLVRDIIDKSKPLAARWADAFKNADALFVVGGGANVPTAEEGALKVLEVAKMPVVFKELEEMMHGPFNGVGPDTGIILVADDSARADRIASFLKGVALIGTRRFAIGASPLVAEATSFDLLLPNCGDAAVRAILAVIPFQLLAHDLAAARGVDIDVARYPQLYPVFVSKSIHK